MFRLFSRLCHRMAVQSLQSFLFADLSGYSSLTEREGDAAAADVAIRFAAEVARLAAERGIDLVKCVGDEVMVRGEDAAAVVRLGLSLQAELGGRQSFPEIHAGVHTGVAVERGGDWWGATVNIASRVATAAEAGQLLITEATRTAAAADLSEARLRGLGPTSFRNISSPVSVYEVTSTSAGADHDGLEGTSTSSRRPRRTHLAPKLAPLPVAG
jgi:adenylate cyclase